MKKTYVIDTNILIQAPHAFLCFEENDVVRMLEQYRNQGDLLQGVTLPDGGTLRIEKNYKAVELPEDMPEDKADKIQEIFERGIIQTEALNFIRGCSIAKIYLIIDDAQNMTLNQVRGIITRAGKGTKIILLGDPCQIDRPFPDERTNDPVMRRNTCREVRIVRSSHYRRRNASGRSLQMISCGGWICRLQIVQPSFLRLGITTSQPEVPWILCQRR